MKVGKVKIYREDNEPQDKQWYPDLRLDEPDDEFHRLKAVLKLSYSTVFA